MRRRKHRCSSGTLRSSGLKPRASEIMNRKRPLTLRMIQKINSNWKISAASLIAPYHLEANSEGA